jgi:hypothetical protein
VGFPTITERYGSLSATGIAKETTFGTGVAPTSFQPMTSNTYDVDPGWFSPEVMQAVRDKQIYNLYGEAKYDGSVGGPVFPGNGIMQLVYAIGTDVVSGTGAPYTHTISEANTLQSMTIEKNIGGYQSLRFAGVRINKYQLKVATGNTAAEFTADGIGQSAAIIGTPAAVTVSSELPFVFAEASLTMFGNLRSEVSSVSIAIENGVKPTYTFSSFHGPSFITPVTLKVNGQVDLVWSSLNDATYGDYSTMINGTLGALTVALAHPVAANGSVQLSCPQVVLSKYSNDLKIGDVVMSTLNFEASKALPSGSSISAVITNSQSTAY